MRLTALAILLLCLILGLSSGEIIRASTPTPSPTLHDIPSSPTSIFIYLHATPTNLTVVPQGLTMNFNTDPLLTADITINMYRYFNKDHLIDLIGSIILALFVLGLLIRFIGKTTRMNN